MSVEDKIEKVLRIILRTNREQNDLSLYLQLASSTYDDMTEQLCFNLKLHCQLLSENLARWPDKGEVRADIDPPWRHHLIIFHGSPILLYQWIFARKYVYVKEGMIRGKRRIVIAETMKFLRGAVEQECLMRDSYVHSDLRHWNYRRRICLLLRW